MRHRVKGRSLSRSPAHRRAMLRNLVTSLLRHERVETTNIKAKEVRPLAEKIITLGKRRNLHARRQALAVVRSKDVVEKVFGELADRYDDRPGGYTRITKIGYRHGDNAPLSVIELIKDKLKPSRKAKTRPKAKPPPGKEPPSEKELPDMPDEVKPVETKKKAPSKKAPKEKTPPKEAKKKPTPKAPKGKVKAGEEVKKKEEKATKEEKDKKAQTPPQKKEDAKKTKKEKSD